MTPADIGSDAALDRVLIDGLRSGDPDTLRGLMDGHWAPLVGFAHRILAGSAEAEDMVQEAFVRLWARRSTLKTEGSLRSLLYTIVRNACLDELRKKDRRTRAQRKGPPPASPRTPYEDVHGAELQRVAAAAVSNLPAKRQEVFRLVREEGLSYRDVAEVLGLSQQTVANHMSLALADLRTTLRPFMAESRARALETQEAPPKREPSEG
jgi:RNA polymerase sigma-70 factor (ECF subfamily)